MKTLISVSIVFHMVPAVFDTIHSNVLEHEKPDMTISNNGKWEAISLFQPFFDLLQALNKTTHRRYALILDSNNLLCHR